MGAIGTVVAGILEYNVLKNLDFLPILAVSLIEEGLNDLLFVRGLLSPAAHAAWTGSICSILWRERLKADKIQFNFQFLKVFVTAIFFHTLWETLQSSRGVTFIEFLNLEFLSLLVAVTSLNLLIRQLEKAQNSDPVVDSTSLKK